MRILRAARLGMCFGVRDAIALALQHADAGPLTILGDLVHNPTVLGALEAKGITVAQDVADVKTPTLMVTAHGTSQRTLAQTRALGLTVVEATCPLVHVAHRAVTALARDGYHVVIVGQRDHVEVRGLTGDLDRFDVVLEDDDVLALEEHPRIGVAAQTTQAVEKVRRLVDLIRRRFPQSEVRFLDTVCKPTKERQSAAVEMAHQADVVIVVGGRSSNNTRELVKTCARYCARVHHVQTDADVRSEWFDAVKVVGLTAGTSTPDDVIDRVEARIRLCADASASAPASADPSAGLVRQADVPTERTSRGGVEVETQIEAKPRSAASVATGKCAPEESRRRRPRARREVGPEFGRTE
jgi:4-hydroxy-3-methylbut-2-enyl diphosphate reductase